jgi:sugar O-acyltransferase (sialic acid O-acetyltransferase NeuD family)
VTYYIEAPLVNINDDVVTISHWARPEGSQVHKGEVIALLETAKATFDLEAGQAGYLHLFAGEGAQVGVGEVIAAISESADEKPEKPSPTAPAVSTEGVPRKLTKKAEIEARRAGLDIERARVEIPGGGAITESDIKAYLERVGAARPGAGSALVTDTVDDVYPGSRQQRLLLIGGGLGAVQLLDSLTRIDHQRATVIVDDNAELQGKAVMGVPIVGGQDRIGELFKDKTFDAGVVAVSTSISFRERMFRKLTEMGIPLANVVDPTARVQSNAVLGTGNVILAYCHIGSCAVVGNGNFLSPYVDIEHHCALDDFCTFGPGVLTSAMVKVGRCVKFGTGIFVEPKVNIGANSIIGSGAIITRDIPENSIVKTRINYTIRPRG